MSLCFNIYMLFDLFQMEMYLEYGKGKGERLGAKKA